MSKKEKKEIKKYTVKVEALVPATYTYIIDAVSPEEAGDIHMLRRTVPNKIQHKNTIPRIKKILVYEYGMSIIKFMKNLII